MTPLEIALALEHIREFSMRKFFSIGLALVLGFFVTMAPRHVSKGLSAPSDLRIERAAQLISLSSTQSSAVEKDGIRFEILMPEPLLTIPANRPGVETPVLLGIRMTNNTPTSLLFPPFDPLFVLPLEMVGSDGKAIQPQGGRDILLRSAQLACPLAMPGQSLTFFWDAKLFWRNNKLLLGGTDGLGGGWSFENLKPTTYQIRIRYTSSRSVMPCYDQKTDETNIIRGIWTGEASTPFMEFRLVQP